MTGCQKGNKAVQWKCNNALAVAYCISISHLEIRHESRLNCVRSPCSVVHRAAHRRGEATRGNGGSFPPRTGRDAPSSAAVSRPACVSGTISRIEPRGRSQRQETKPASIRWPIQSSVDFLRCLLFFRPRSRGYCGSRWRSICRRSGSRCPRARRCRGWSCCFGRLGFFLGLWFF